MPTSEYSQEFKYGLFDIYVTHHHWNCGDGCCSSSGKTVEIKYKDDPVWYYGSEDIDGHYDFKEFADIAFEEYIKERDQKIQVQRRDRLQIEIQKYIDLSSRYSQTLNTCLAFMEKMVELDIFKTSKLGKIFLQKTGLVNKHTISVLERIPGTLDIYRSNLINYMFEDRK